MIYIGDCVPSIDRQNQRFPSSAIFGGQATFQYNDVLMCALLPLSAHISIAGLHVAGTLLVQSGTMQPLCAAALRSFGKILAFVDQSTQAGEILSYSVWTSSHLLSFRSLQAVAGMCLPILGWANELSTYSTVCSAVACRCLDQH